MVTIDPLMTNAKLKKLLQKEYGMKAPAGANKAKIIELLVENGATVAGETPEPKAKSGKPKKYRIRILAEKDAKGPVPVGVNGRVTLIQRNKEVEVSEPVYLILTQYSNRIVGEPMEDGEGVRTYEQPAYPVTLLGIVE